MRDCAVFQLVAVLEHFNLGGQLGTKYDSAEGVRPFSLGVRGYAPPESFEILEPQKGHFPGFGRGFWQF